MTAVRCRQSVTSQANTTLVATETAAASDNATAINYSGVAGVVTAYAVCLG